MREEAGNKKGSLPGKRARPTGRARERLLDWDGCVVDVVVSQLCAACRQKEGKPKSLLRALASIASRCFIRGRFARYFS